MVLDFLPVLAAVCALLISLLSPLAVRPWLFSLGVVDIASERSSHTGSVVRGLGFCCALAFLVTMTGSALINPALGFSALVWILLGVSGVCTLLGWLEDLRGLSTRVRFLAQMLIGAGSGWLLAEVTGVSAWFILVALVAIPVAVNATNFMDGVNGITSLYGCVAGAYFSFLGWRTDTEWLIWAGLILAAAFLGFLPWNFGFAKFSGSFMGDVGPYFLGSALATMAMGAFFSGIAVESVLAPFIIYLADTGATLARRILGGKNWTQAHREHVYQRLTDVGLTHLQSSLLVVTFTVLMCMVGSSGASQGTERLNEGAFLTILLILVYLALPRIMKTLTRNPASSSDNKDESDDVTP